MMKEYSRKPAVSSAWTQTIPRKRILRSRNMKVLRKHWRMYCEHSSLVGLKYFVREDVTWLEKFVWFLLFSIAAIQMYRETFATYRLFHTTPIVSMMEPEYFPTSELQFPGVAVCTVNRISLRSATKLATEIFEANITNMSAKEIVHELTNLGDLYDTSFMRESSYDNLRELLSKFYNNSYDITDLMESLTPRCSDILLECSFLNKKRKCTDIFSLGKTHNGFCCTFNYVIEPDDMPKFTEVPEPVIYLVGTASFYYGLSVMMVPQLDDYAYTLLPTTGWKVMIFDPYGYPDLSSGSVSEVLVPPLTEEFVQLQVVGSHGTDTIRMHSVEKRGCIFPDEYESNYTSYSTNACIVACRVEHIWAKCKCRPFFYPRQGFTEKSRRTCTIEDIHCLTKYYEKQYNIVPYAHINLDSDFENENVIRCNNCYPECIDMSYLIQISETDIKSSYFNVTLYPNTNVKDQSILHIYFSDLETGFLRKDVHYRWYEYLSFIGGTYGLFVGFSIVSVVEIIYFITSYLLETFLPPAAEKPSRENTTRSIYWNEFLSHSRVNVERPAIRY